MNDENNYGEATAPVLDDIEYTAPAKKEGPQGVAAPVLDDMDYVAPVSRKDGPQGVAAPVLDDMDSYTPNYSAKKGAPQGVTAPVLDDDDSYTSPSASSPKKPLILSDDEIIAGLSAEQKAMYDTLPAEKQQQIIDMRRSQLGAEAPAPAITAPVLDDDNYVPPVKKEEPQKPAEPITAPVLDDEPEQTEYVPKFANDDLERIKKEAAKKAVSSQLVSNQKDEKESLRMMLDLKAQHQQEAAKQGFKICLILVVLGIIGSAAFFFLYAGMFGLSYKDGMSGFSNIIKESALYIAVVTALVPFALLTGSNGLKGLTSFVYLIFGFIQVIPGIAMIPQHEGSMGLAVGLYAAALICTLAVFITLSASESVGLFFRKPQAKNRYDRD